MALTSGSATGAFEAALFSLLGPEAVDAVAYEHFGRLWADTARRLQPDTRCFSAPHFEFPNCSESSPNHDLIVVYSGTITGVQLPTDNWIGRDARGLSFCDLSSAAFTRNIDWSVVDVGAFAWQKGLGGEAQHGTLVLSRRACERLELYQPPWPVPSLYRVTEMVKRPDHEPLNTPSLLALADFERALQWAESCGGRRGLFARVELNRRLVHDWIEAQPSFRFVVSEPAFRASACVCFDFASSTWLAHDIGLRRQVIEAVAGFLADYQIAFETGGHRSVAPCFRVWLGPTVDANDLFRMALWFDWIAERLRGIV
jgi:phosphoserine aminotransferase